MQLKTPATSIFGEIAIELENGINGFYGRWAGRLAGTLLDNPRISWYRNDFQSLIKGDLICDSLTMGNFLGSLNYVKKNNNYTYKRIIELVREIYPEIEDIKLREGNGVYLTYTIKGRGMFPWHCPKEYTYALGAIAFLLASRDDKDVIVLCGVDDFPLAMLINKIQANKPVILTSSNFASFATFPPERVNIVTLDGIKRLVDTDEYKEYKDTYDPAEMLAFDYFTVSGKYY